MRFFRRTPKVVPSTWTDARPDPLDQDVMGPGDPLFDNVFGPMMRGETGAVIVTRDGDQWTKRSVQ